MYEIKKFGKYSIVKPGEDSAKIIMTVLSQNEKILEMNNTLLLALSMFPGLEDEKPGIDLEKVKAANELLVKAGIMSEAEVKDGQDKETIKVDMSPGSIVGLDD